MSIPFQPADGFMLVEEFKHEKTEGGILVTKSEEDDLSKVKIVAVGPGEVTETGHRREVLVKPGDVCYVLSPRYAQSSPITLGGKQYRIMQSKFICGYGVE